MLCHESDRQHSAAADDAYGDIPIAWDEPSALTSGALLVGLAEATLHRQPVSLGRSGPGPASGKIRVPSRVLGLPLSRSTDRLRSAPPPTPCLPLSGRSAQTPRSCIRVIPSVRPDRTLDVGARSVPARALSQKALVGS
jgi:hypothetical protein